MDVDASTVDLAGDELVVEFGPERTGNGLVETDPAGNGARMRTAASVITDA